MRVDPIQRARVDPIQRALQLRKTLRLGDKVLVADFTDTLQGKDTSKVIDLMPIVGTNYYVFRAKVNIKELDPIASERYGVEFFDITQKTDEEIEAFIRKQEFDFPLWYKYDKDFSMPGVCDYNPPFILQVAGCNFHDGSSAGGCWYCFVDDKSNDGKIGKGKTFLGIDETIESMLSAREKIKAAYKKKNKDLNLKVLRVSGGEPTLVLDWILDLWREVSRRGLDFVGQLDSNLSTGTVVDSFERQGIYESNILKKLAEYPVKILTALKGVDEENLQNNVQSSATMEVQEYSLKKLLKVGFDIYPQMYNPNPETLEYFLKEIDGKIENLSLRIHLSPLKIYGPNTQRLMLEARRNGMDPEEFIAEKKKEWDENYKKGCEVLDSYLRKEYKVGYKEVTRSDVKLRIKS